MPALPTSIAASPIRGALPRPAQPDPADPQVGGPPRRSSTAPSTSAPSAATASRVARVSAARRGSPRSAVSPSPIAADQRRAVGDRLVGRRVAARRAAGPTGSKRARGSLAVATGTPCGRARARSRPRARPRPRRRPTARPRRCACRRPGTSAMSSMLTPARPSASAISATVPGRFSTRPAARSSSPPTSSASSRRRRSRRAPRCQSATRLGVARAQQLGRLAQPLDDRVDLARDAPRGWWRRCRPRSRGWRPRPGSCRGSSARPRAGARTPRPSAAAACGDEHVGDHVREVADGRHQPVVGLGVDRLRAGAEVGDRALQAVVQDAARALGRRQVPARALEQVGARVLDPGGLGAGQRVAADEALALPRLRQLRDQVALGRADVGDHRVARRSPSSASATSAGQRADRRGAEDDLGAVDRLGDRSRARVERLALAARARGSPGRGRSPATSAPSRRLAASPIEPPISPTPRTAILIGASLSDARESSLPASSATARDLLRVLGEAARSRSPAGRRRSPRRARCGPRR